MPRKMIKNSYFIVICMLLVLVQIQAAPRESAPNARLVKRTPYEDLGHGSHCYWEGTSPFCQGECPPGFKLMHKDAYGDTVFYVDSKSGSHPQPKLNLNMPKDFLFFFCSFFLILVLAGAAPSESQLLNHTPLIMGPHCHMPFIVNKTTCYWKGLSPFCFTRDDCPENTFFICKDRCGDGACCWTGGKSLCCPMDQE